MDAPSGTFIPHQHKILERIQRAAASLGEFPQNDDGHFQIRFLQSRQEIPTSEGEALCWLRCNDRGGAQAIVKQVTFPKKKWSGRIY